jgi:CDP-diacylglycerol--serine O-phosphatidyltransferase
MKRPPLGGAAYVLPNLLTTGNLFFGFFSIIKCLQGDFKWAASAILLATIFDVLDGRVARLTGGTSEFGVQYDSLCDLISFGLAPAFLMYKFALNEWGRPGWLICFLFLACGALRLARFNVQSSVGKASSDFTGLPIPMAAAVISTYVASCVEFRGIIDAPNEIIRVLASLFQSPKSDIYVLLIGGAYLSFAMVSNFAYRSHKAIRISILNPFKILVLFVIILVVGAYQPELFGFLATGLYALSGPLEWLLGWKKPIDDDELFRPLKGDDNDH